MDRKWFKIGTGSAVGITTIIGLFLFLTSMYNFEITGTDDICMGTLEDPCISYITVKNPTKYNVDVYNQNEIKLAFSPQIPEYYLFRKDGRCRGGDSCAAPNGVSLPGWNFIDFTNETKPVKDKVYVFRFPAYSTKEFLLWGLKNNPNERVKWTFTTEKGELDPVWEGEELSNFTLLKDCKNITRERWVPEIKEVFIDCSLNASCEDHYENHTIYVKEIYYKEVCKETGVKSDNKEIKYQQLKNTCLRTDNILCCWDNRDGGINLAGRKGEARTTIYSGESGECQDLNDNLKVLSSRSDYKDFKIEHTLTEVAK